MKNGSKSERKEHPMKQYKFFINCCEYTVSYTCDTISDAYGCLRSIANWVPKIEIDPDDLMVALVQMRNGVMLGRKCSAYSIDVLEEE